MKRANKLSTSLIIVCLIALCCFCFTAFTCGPYPMPFLYDLAMVEFEDVEHGAYFLKAENHYGGYGYFTDKNGARISAFYDFDYNEYVTVKGDFDGAIYFEAQAYFDEEQGTLSLTVTDAFVNVDLNFTELTFTVNEIDNSALRPHDLISATWEEDNGSFTIMSTGDTTRSARLVCYSLTDEGYIEYNSLLFVWLDGGFNIMYDGNVLASGTYDFDGVGLEITLVFENDDLFGENKPFASYPALTLKARRYY